jgi:protein TonB
MYSARASADRLLIALVIAAALHLLVIFGLHFELPKALSSKRSLAVTLVRAPVKKPPQQAEFLSEQNQLGSGKAPKPPEPQAAPPAPPKPKPERRPPPIVPAEKPLPKPAAKPKPQPVAKPAPKRPEQTLEKPAPRPKPPPRKRVEKPVERPMEEPLETLAKKPPPEDKPAAPKRRVIAQRKSEKKIHADEGKARESKAVQPRLSAELLSQQISEVSADVERHHEAEARGPRVAYVNSVNAHQYKAADYEQAWQQKVERVGNLNYPEEARRQHLSGSLVLAVGIRPDGSLDHIKVRHSSGEPVLDAAAERIVRMAAPFAPFPADLKREVDILVITRTWRFYNDYRLETD